MKKIQVLLFLLIPLIVNAQKDKFILNGKIGNLNSPSKIYLSYISAAQMHLDSAILSEGKFKFKGEIDGVTKAYLSLSYSGISMHSKPYHIKPIYLETGNIVVESSDSLKNAIVSGTKANVDLERYNATLVPFNKKIYEWIANTRKLSEDQKSDTSFIKMNNNKYDAIREEIRNVTLTFVNSNPESMVSLDLITNEIGGKVPEFNIVAPIFLKLSKEVRESTLGKKYWENLMRVKATSVGTAAPDFTQNNVYGKPVRLSDLRGKYVLIDFWASWCYPCRKENPHFLKVYEKYKDRGFEIIGISLDHNKNAWINAIEEDQLTWINVSDLKGRRNVVAEKYAIKAVPQNFLIDTEGRIVSKNLKSTDLQKKLEELLR